MKWPSDFQGGCFFVLVFIFYYCWLRQKYHVIDVVISLLLIALGTNLWFYTVKQPGMSHVYSFGILSCILFLVDRWYRSRTLTWPNAILLGFLLAWLILIRPTNGLAFLFLLCYTIQPLFHLKQRWALYQKSLLKIIPFALFSIILWGIQLLQWHEMTGSWSLYSYSGEGFIYWKEPRLLRVLFDVQNGLLVYSSVLLISLYGLLRNIQRPNSRHLLLLFLLLTWLFGSWWTWWFGAAYGHRCYIEYYSLFILPMIGVVESVRKSNQRFIQVSFFMLAILMVYYSVNLTEAYEFPWEGPTWTWDRFSDIVRSFF